MPRGRLLRIEWWSCAIVSLALAFALVPACASKRRTVSRGAAALVTPHGALTNGADDMRTGLYPNQPKLNPAVVGGPTFGRLWRTVLPGAKDQQVFAQPMVMDGKVLVVTESNNVYLLDGETGAILAMRMLGQPWQASHVGCSDLEPDIGITGTPVIDVASRTAYFLSKTYRNGVISAEEADAVWWAHAVDFDTLAEKPNFPMEIKGTASNKPSIAFEPFLQHQRPGLLLMNGVIYVAFGAHCDWGEYRGWVIAFTPDGKIKSMFANELTDDGGAGIWQAGSGLMSDGPGRIFFATGNSGVVHTGESPEATPTDRLGESVVRLQVEADGSMRAADFFCPYDRYMLDISDADLGSGGPVGLPDSFGTPEHPHLMTAAGKGGVLYLLDRDKLGGFRQGPAGADNVLGAISLIGGSGSGVYSRPAVWPANGGYIYMVIAAEVMQVFRPGKGGDGKPALSEAARTNESFGYSSGSPIITSDGMNGETAVLWDNHASGTYGLGTLRAYDAIPDGSGKLRLRFSEDYGDHSKHSQPGVGDGRIYVGAADGQVLAYGTPANTPASAASVAFGAVVVGNNSVKQATITANQDLMVTALALEPSAFMLGAPSMPLPATLAKGGVLTVPVTYTPPGVGVHAAALNVTTSAGLVTAGLTGRGISNTPLLDSSVKVLSFGGLGRGRSKTLNAILSNAGAQPLTWTAFTLPMGPFTVSGLPPANGTLAAGGEVTISVKFAPDMDGAYTSSLVVRSTGGDVTINMSGTAGAPPKLVINPPSLDFGVVPVGSKDSRGFVISNEGGSNLTIFKSKAPTRGTFRPEMALDEGVVLAPGASKPLTVIFEPKMEGEFADEWILTGDDEMGERHVALTGRTSGAAADGGARDGAAGDGAAGDGAKGDGATEVKGGDGGCGCSVGGLPAGGSLPLWLAVAATAIAVRRRRSLPS